MKPQISVKAARDIDATNAYYVTITQFGESKTVTAHTNPQGGGLWIDGEQVEGTSQFHARRNPASAMRRYFERVNGGGK